MIVIMTTHLYCEGCVWVLFDADVIHLNSLVDLISQCGQRVELLLSCSQIILENLMSIKQFLQTKQTFTLSNTWTKITIVLRKGFKSYTKITQLHLCISITLRPWSTKNDLSSIVKNVCISSLAAIHRILIICNIDRKLQPIKGDTN